MITPKLIDISIHKLTKRNIGQYLKLENSEELEFDACEVRSLLNFASLLSLSDERHDLSLAYELCSRLLELFGQTDQYLLGSADLILSRIGNFPGRTLLRKKFLNSIQPQIPFSLAIERLARESENSIDDKNVLTDFQYKLFASLETETSISISAPTSAGKSHVLNLDLIRKLGSEEKSCIVYIIPTRALVSEVVLRVRASIRAEGIQNIFVRTAPFQVENLEDAHGIVYVLTQERLMRLLSSSDERLDVTCLIIDEAHEIQKGKRGILLQNAVELTIRKSPKATVLFASPLIKNPAYLLEIFKRSDNGRYFTEQISPVSQNIILVSEVPRKPKKVTLKLVSENAVFNIGTSELSFDFRGSKSDQIARFAVEICQPAESVILFADDPSHAEDGAISIAKYISIEMASSEIIDFMNFIKSEIHPEYPLIECLEKGVAFHYGNMPSIVRTTVERLFKSGHLKYLSCTSTLLQGVNLPAKHIVIQDPHLGNEAMGRADFRNLAGRAGRLLKEFHGNVWCLRPGSWKNESFKGENLQEIRAAMEVVMSDGGSLIGAISEGIDIKEQAELGDAAFSRLYHEIRENGVEQVFLDYKSESNSEILRTNIEQLSALQIDVPSEILDAHRSLRPDLLQELLNRFRSMENIENAALINPHERRGKERMEFAMSTINQAFGITMHDKYFNWISTTAHRWAWGTPVGEMLSERITFSRNRDPKAKASPIIRELLKLIETEIRYKLAKYFAAYEDLLRLAWWEKKAVENKNIAPYHIYLEFGASDAVALSLMTLGLSRFTAIKLKKAIFWSNEIEPEDYLKKINLTDIKSLAIPQLCKIELLELFGR